MKKNLRFNALLAIIMLLTGVATTAGTAQAADPPAGWRDTSVSIKYSNAFYSPAHCFDGVTPNVYHFSGLYSDYPDFGTVSVNLATGTYDHSPNYFILCNPYTGYSYRIADEGSGVVYSPAFPNGRTIAHQVTHYATDGSLYVYSLQVNSQTVNGKIVYTSTFFTSSDGGLNWTEGSQQLGGILRNITVAKADGRALYGVSQVKDAVAPNKMKYSVYFSADAGVTWEKRSEHDASGIYFEPEAWLPPLPGFRPPVDYLAMMISNGGAGSSGGNTNYLSTDGGRTFQTLGSNGMSGSVSTFYSADGILRLKAAYMGSYQLERSKDGGATWQGLPIPAELMGDGKGVPPSLTVQALSDAPSSFLIGFTNLSGNLWYSGDSGTSWQKLGANMAILDATPYAPFKLLAQRDGRLYTLDLPAQSSLNMTKPAPADLGFYFVETRHNLSPFFRQYWEANGGTAQFGYAKTEPFREVNPSDGKIYVVQYFERARFEYHPENKGTPYEILLGLLGVQFTEQQRASGNGAFNRFEDMHYPGATYFPQTGHNLRNSFKAYWEANGGLSMYGYPISEEFNEVNPDDGKIYVVQYFERNRFEWHPENAGTHFEVLLGLLGNALLRQKGWQ